MEMEYHDDTKRRKVFIVLGVVLAVVAGGAAFYLVNQAQSAGNAAVPTRQVVVAARDLPLRTVITASDITVRSVPDDPSVLSAYTTPEEVVALTRERGEPRGFWKDFVNPHGPGDDIGYPARGRRLDYEGEIAMVIGKGGRRIREDQAWEHIAGYACYNDGSVRDWQSATPQWTAGKNFWRTGGFGPWMVDSSEIEPGRRMTLVTRLNGVEMQRATTDMMIHSIPRQIAYRATPGAMRAIRSSMSFPR